MAEVSISAFAADFFHLERDLEMIRQCGADGVHVDAMDGHFVPLFGFHQLLIRRMAAFDRMCGDVHLMAEVTQPMLDQFLELPCQRLTLHIEAAEPEILTGFLGQIREAGIEAGLAIAPWTEPEKLIRFLPYIKEILVMSCAPGTEGAAFEEGVYERIRRIRELLKAEKPEGRIAVDGGLNEERAVSCVKSGADRVIIGRAFFTSEDKKGLVERVRQSSFENLKAIEK